jgi:signal transduction histidine kinase
MLMAISSVALLVACAAFMFYDSLLVRREMASNLVALTRVVGGMNWAALTFDEPATTRESLAALADRQNIISARVYSTNQTLFAEYIRQGATAPPRPAPTSDGHLFESDRLVVYQRIPFKNEIIGSIIVESDLDELNSRLHSYIGIALTVLLLSLAVALLLSTVLQRLIARPIVQLAQTMRKVSQEKNYALRAELQRDDEVGDLVRGFNDMLAQIQQRDAELQKAADELEKRVVERTSELEKTLERLRATATQLERSNRELQDFAYVASHDLQEPLRKVQAFGDRLQDKYAPQLGDEGRDFISRMQNAAGRMQSLINDLLTFSRVTTKASPFEKVDLARVAREVISDLEVRIQQSQANVEAEPLPSVEADPLQMRQLFQNLIGNALKFHKDGTAPVVRIRARILRPPDSAPGGQPVEQETLELSVQDNGIGFDEKYLDRIFAVFQRLHGRGVYEGTGIGLAICRKIAERHGGAITGRSRPGEGATFIVTLPLRHAPT